MSLEATEAECAANAVAPRVSLTDIEGAIAERHHMSAAEAIAPHALASLPKDHPFRLLSICILRLHNGWTVIGKSAPASAANFNAELGRKLAYEDCIRQLWPLMGFALRERLARENHPPGAPHISTKSTELDSH